MLGTVLGVKSECNVDPIRCFEECACYFTKDWDIDMEQRQEGGDWPQSQTPSLKLTVRWFAPLPLGLFSGVYDRNAMKDHLLLIRLIQEDIGMVGQSNQMW
jgi:hypothetical protein